MKSGVLFNEVLLTKNIYCQWVANDSRFPHVFLT